MKIITDNMAYVQKRDLVYIRGFFRGCAEFRYITDIINSSKGISLDEFIEFNDSADIEFFKNYDALLDYYAIKDKTEEEIQALIQNMQEEQDDIAQKFNSMSEEEQNENIDLDDKCDLLEFKMNTLREFLEFKQGKREMKFPEGIDLPTGYKKKILKKYAVFKKMTDKIKM